MDNFRVAVKSFIVKGNKMLLLKRRSNDVHKPGAWDIPGGRLDIGEDPFLGVKRETMEETGLNIETVLPLDIHHFTRDDGQKITMIVFLCKALSGDVKLSEEHTEHKWIDVNSGKENFPNWLHPVVDNMLKYDLNRYI